MQFSNGKIYKQVKTSTQGPFTNYVYKSRGVVGQKNRLFVNFYTIENVNRGGVGGQKMTNLVNVVCERPLRLVHKISLEIRI